MINRDRIIEFMREKIYKPLPEDELLAALVPDHAERPAWKAILEELEAEGVVVKTRYGRYGLPENMNLVVGSLQGHSKGYAFLLTPPEESDVFISASHLNGAMHGDRVIARLLQPRGNRNREGEVIRILKRAQERIVGRFEGGEQVGFCLPDDKRIGAEIVIAHGETKGAATGDKVVVRITRFPEGRHSALGVIEEVLGRAGEPSVEILSVVKQYSLPERFPPEVHEQLSKMRLEIGEEDISGRQDLRELQVLTIDGADAKDLDDAISLEKLTNGNYKLGVHIADVGHYVQEGTPLDKEAYERGTSVYLLDRVLPMLPPDLSNGICSLNPRVDRLVMSLFMEINDKGNVVEHELHEAVIHSKARMTYGEVNRLLGGEEGELLESYQEQIEQLRLMEELRNILVASRGKRGGIDFAVSEAKILLNEDGSVKEIVPRTKTLADSIIEEFMVLANETVAERFFWLDAPYVYRVHEEPNLEKVTELNQFLGAFGLRIKHKKDEIHPKSFQKVLEEVEGRREQRLIHRVLLRSMMRARYSPECLGHFGLASKYYCHFTSPIRRYPDLVIHRIMKEYLKSKQFPEKRKVSLAAFVDRAAVQSSEREQLATEAERDVVDMKKVEFMAGKEGEICDAIISGVTNFGFFVELENTVEGLVHISTLDDDYYQYDEETYALYGRHTKHRFRLGDPVRVKVTRVDLLERKIDFELAEERPE